MDLSVIILNFNASAFLELCLDSVFKAVNDIDAEIIVVDNNSIDNSLEMLESNFPQVKIIANNENLGFSKGNNIGVKQAQGEYVCILNPDTIVGETVFNEMFAFAKANSQIAFTTTQLIDGTGAFLPESKRNVPTPKIAKQKILGNDTNYYANHLSKDENGDVEVLVGAMMVCKKAVYDELGGFDPIYFMYGEDIDLSYTALQRGYKNHYLGTQKIIHFKGESTIKDKKYLQRFYGAMGLFYDKHFKKSRLEKTIVDIALKGIIAAKSNDIDQARIDTNKYQVLVTDREYLHLNFFDKVISFQELSSLKLTETTQIIWDATSISYVEIIEFMSQNSQLGITYRFMSPRQDFIIGSDSSTTRGEVKQLEL